jgi:hypothetical protein
MFPIRRPRRIITSHGVALSADGARLITSGDDGLRAYLVRIEDLVLLAQARDTRSFTLAECQQYLHLTQCPAHAAH